MNLSSIQQRIQNGHYLIRSHVLQQALKEGFSRREMLEAILNGQIIEEYPDAQRVLVCSYTKLAKRDKIYLHVVCEVADPIFVELVTAYFPDESLWERPDFKRRRRKRK